MLVARLNLAFKAFIICVVVYFIRHYRHRRLWLISDRRDSANDNGEVLFNYINRAYPEIDVRFVIEKNIADYHRLKKVGRVIPWMSWRHKVFVFIADCLISSQAQHSFTEPVAYAWSIRRLLRIDVPFVFLQHGVTKDNLSMELSRSKRNISGFITSSSRERASILSGKYGYRAADVWLTGMPRYDLLRSSPRKVVLIMPTWRLRLTDGMSSNGKWILSSTFSESLYCRFFNAILSNSLLNNVCKMFGYRIIFVLHPNFRSAKQYFRSCGAVVTDASEIGYTRLFSDGSILITDYSSVAFDFAYLRKPVVYAQFDKREFFSSHSYCEGYFDYDTDGFGEIETTVDGLVHRIMKYISSGCHMKKVFQNRVNEFFAFSDRNNCKRVVKQIISLCSSCPLNLNP